MNNISIIIPVLNEAENIPKLKQHLSLQSTTNIIEEIIIVDGGSRDNTIEIAKSLTTKVINSRKGRAIQMNLGAKHARGSILYFLHADSFPPSGFDRLIFQEIKNGNQAGCFKMKFDSNHWWLHLAGWFTKFNWKACRGGDQSLFITRELFEELQGYDENFTIYEDIDLINKLYAKNEFTVIQQPIITSARRYKKKGIVKLQTHFWMIYLKKFFGASANDLNNYYNKYIL
ncbi:TIGR04283 family arsenosugar biosynthesis glycosyltransferase [Flavobacteriaceae sp. LMIT009]